MTAASRPARRRRRPVLGRGVAIAAAVVTFAIGLALGQALEEGSGGGETQTSIRTLAPETLPAQTVTVTVTAP